MLSSQCGLAGMKEDSPAATEAEVHVRACNSYSTTCCPSSVSRPTKTLRESHTLLSLISQLIVTVKCHANRVDEGKKTNSFLPSSSLCSLPDWLHPWGQITIIFFSFAQFLCPRYRTGGLAIGCLINVSMSSWRSCSAWVVTCASAIFLIFFSSVSFLFFPYPCLFSIFCYKCF